MDRTARRRAQERDGGLGGGANIVRFPMPGRIVKVLVSAGDTVVAGQGIVIVEAMKMKTVSGLRSRHRKQSTRRRTIGLRGTQTRTLTPQGG